MKALFIAVLLGVGITHLYADKPSKALTAAQIHVESKGDDMAIGDNGNANGCLQIWQIVVDEYNQDHGMNYRATDCLGNHNLSVTIYDWYIDHWATEKRLGHTPTNEDKARIWNGGPFGCFDNGAINKNGTLLKNPVKRAKLAKSQAKAKKYWLRVQSSLVSMK